MLTKKIEVRLNRIVRIATFSSIYTPINTMYKQLNILKISDIYHLELGKFMYQHTVGGHESTAVLLLGTFELSNLIVIKKTIF